ncbi:MAG: DUF1330 domain-containing protein [Candidatus Marinimicrobia bacterium]|nr:DUF1330 domain-containing protein [Candidatus Neomarinimicrobiota bacterium]MBT4176983.1 DUF1330 domain-containing protein [Candidatus Neomarinimicrobiota bacterium]MBT4593281.1 DUF1330 domain-containing protein [Candidatus Neomarinimicrobiota bacterium]MBT6736687.1 DUF1330 domain-containing protein [Candidatus Neomarinimicrobiota bacterium]MBT6914220.1 DUF1330 domain-containing protein [Candidatus Neomarinimicrobiota bacterium]
MSEQNPHSIVVVLRGKLAVGSKEIYGKYLEASTPIAKKYGAKVLAVGDILTRDYLDVTLPLTIVISFETEENCDGYFLDSEYIKIKEKYRDPSYEKVHISVFKVGMPITENDTECVVASFANLIPGTEDQYQAYLHGVLGIAKNFGLSLLAGGKGLDKSYANPAFEINSLLKFPTADKADAFFNDPEYQKIAEKRHASYTDAELGMFKPRVLNLD